MSTPRDKAWYLVHDPTDEVAELERRLDRLDAQIYVEESVQLAHVQRRLAGLGIEANLKPLSPLVCRSRNHIKDGDDVDAIIADAHRSELDRLYEEHIGSRDNHDHDGLLRRPGGHVIGVR